MEDSPAPAAEGSPRRLARVIGEARSNARLTQEQLAEKCGLSQGMLSAYEKGTRRPSLDTVDRLLAVLGLQLRLTIEPLWADVDAEIERARATPIQERLGHRAGSLARLVEAFAGIPHVVGGLTAAALLGAPVPVRWFDLVLPTDDDVLERFVASELRVGLRRWNERWQEFGFVQIDPRLPGPLRYETIYGELRLRLVDTLPEHLLIRVEDVDLPVVPLHAVEVEDEYASRVLERMRRRLACSS